MLSGVLWRQQNKDSTERLRRRHTDNQLQNTITKNMIGQLDKMYAEVEGQKGLVMWWLVATIPEAHSHHPA